MSANKIIIYVCLIFLYLGLSKSLSPLELGISYVSDNESLSQLVRGSPLTVILTDIHSTGFIIKTYYHKYRVVYGFQTYEELIVRVSRLFTNKHSQNIGMSIMRRNSNNLTNFTPLPPGFVFINNSSFGSWITAGDKNNQIWKFYRAYRYLPKYLGLKDFKITRKFYEKSLLSEKENTSFIGFNDEFGINGEITKKSYPNFFKKKKNNSESIKTYIKNYFKNNFYK